jgi:hypothetical protein
MRDSYGDMHDTGCHEAPICLLSLTTACSLAASHTYRQENTHSVETANDPFVHVVLRPTFSGTLPGA